MENKNDGISDGGVMSRRLAVIDSIQGKGSA
jgi:hypothetical protein